MLPTIPLWRRLRAIQRARLLDIASVTLLTLAVVAFFWPLIFAGCWLPRGGGDLVSFLWPMYRFAARSLRSGVVPLWNPHLHSGAPFIADNQSGVFYPINLLTFALAGPPSYRVMELLVALHIWIAAIGMFVLLRSLRLRRSAAVLGALSFALSDLFVTHLGNLNLNATAAWLPLLLCAAHRALSERRVEWAAGAGGVLAVAALAGHAQMLLFIALALGLLVLCHLIRDALRGAGPGRALGSVGLALIILAIGLGGAALTLLPAWQMAQHTGRGHLPYAEATRYSLPPRALVGLVVPGFYGRGAARFWGSWERVEVGYAGVVTLPLAALGVLFALSRRPPASVSRSRTSPVATAQRPVCLLFFTLLVPLGFLLAMGRHTPLYRLLYRLVPTFDQIRAPARLVLLGDLGLAAMAAHGLDRLVALRASHRWHALVALAVITAAVLVLIIGLPQARLLPLPDRIEATTRSVVVAGSLLALTGLLLGLVGYRPRARWLFPLLLALDLVLVGSTVEIEPNDPTLGFHHPGVVAFLKDDPTLFRIDDAAAAWQPDAALVHGLYDIAGVYNPLSLAPYEAYRWAVGGPGSPLYNLLGVKYVLTDSGAHPGSEDLVPVYAGQAVDVHLNPNALPRALIVTQADVVSDHADAWAAIHDPTFDPSQVVVLEQGGTPIAPTDAGTQGPKRVSFLHYGLNRLRLRVESGQGGWLVLSDVFYPGWRATVAGEPTPVLRANYTFRAVSVPAGGHPVEMWFAPRTWYVGLGISLGTWLALAAVALRAHAVPWWRTVCASG